MTNLPSLEAASGAVAQRIRFVAEAPPGAVPLWELADPYPRLAVAEELSPAALTNGSARGPAPGDAFDFLFLPAGSATPIEWQRAAETWISQPLWSAESSLTEPPEFEPALLDLTIQSDRILWRPGKAVLVGSGKRLEETRAGLIDFSFHESELRKLESELSADWPQAEVDALAAHDVDRQALADCRHITEMSQRTALRRIRFARLGPALEKASTGLTGPTRRMVAELVLQTEIVDRLKHVDDRLEVFEDLYELANDRLAEFRFFRHECRLEEWIIVILVVEVVLIVFEIWLTWWLAD
jgi:hypothetical protein